MTAIARNEHAHLRVRAYEVLDGAVMASRNGDLQTVHVWHRDDDDFVHIRFCSSAQSGSEILGTAGLLLQQRSPNIGQPTQAALLLDGWYMVQPGQGFGNSFMTILAAFADQFNYPIYLKNIPTGATAQERDRFWRRHGFFDCTNGACKDYWRPVDGAPVRTAAASIALT